MERFPIVLLFLVSLGACKVPEVSPPPSATESAIPILDPAEVRRPPESVLDSFVGCYEFAVTIRSEAEVTERLRAELRKTQANSPNSLELELSPRPPMKPSWSVRGGEAVFSWSTGFTGLSFRLRKGGNQPEATMGRFADAGPDLRPTFHPVAVKRVPCGG
jgi:hypothetical protein